MPCPTIFSFSFARISFCFLVASFLLPFLCSSVRCHSLDFSYLSFLLVIKYFLSRSERVCAFDARRFYKDILARCPEQIGFDLTEFLFLAVSLLWTFLLSEKWVISNAFIALRHLSSASVFCAMLSTRWNSECEVMAKQTFDVQKYFVAELNQILLLPMLSSL